MLEADYLAGLPETLAALYAQAEDDILADMARRVSAYDYWIPAAEHQRRALAQMGAVQVDILRELSRRTGRAETELERLMKEAAEKTLGYDGETYRAHGLAPPPPGASPEFKQLLTAGMEQAKGLFTNLTRTTANTASGQFEAALDRVWLQISSGAFDYNAAIRMAVKDLARQGVGAVRYPTGHTDTLETAVRRAVVTGVNQTCGKLQLALADEMGCDLMELTAHAGARPGHAAWQGRIVSRSGRRGYLTLSDIGYGTGAGFKGWNCRHDWNPYFEGSPRAYTEETLKRFDEPKYSYNGQRLTEYEAAQRQRAIERSIRRWKRENKAMEAAGLDGSESAAKIKQWQAAQKDFLRQTGLKPQEGRERVEMPAAKAAGVPKNTGKKVAYNPNADFSIKVDGYDEQVLSGLSKASAEVAREGAADGLEHLRLVDLESGEVSYQEIGERDAVGGIGFWGFIKGQRSKRFAFVHNHPTDGYLSEADMRTLLAENPVDMFVAVRHDGIRYVAEKRKTPAETFNFDALYQDEINSLNQKVRDGKITASDRMKLREELLVNNLLRDYTKGLIELE